MKKTLKFLKEHKQFTFFGILAILIILAAIFAPLLTGGVDPLKGSLTEALEAPGKEHIFGTDKMGRDIYARVIYGARASLTSTFGVVVLIFLVGSVVGVIAGYFGGKIDAVLMRIADMMLAFPGLVLALAVAGIMGGKGRVIPGQPSTKSGKAYKEFYYSSAQVKVDDMSNVNDVAKQIREMGYNVETNVEYMDSMKKQMAVIQAVLGGIGAISLIVAAIGIANTMMMSIYERTKEIGVIKVLGCSLKNIKQMFLIEAAFIGLLGGIVGNMVSFAMSGAINMVTAQSSTLGVEGNISYIPVWLVLISLGFAMLVGMVAGYFPALRAMRLSPLAAIRSE